MKSTGICVPTRIVPALILGLLALPAPAVYAQQLEEIVVTARKRQESLQDAPISITAFNSDAMEARLAGNIGDLGRFTPNMQFDQNAPNSGFANSSAVSIRAIGQTDHLLTIDPGVGIFLDGVYISRSIGTLADTYDIESVEILKGPQGTLFGKNTIGGAMIVTGKRPTDTFTASLEGTTGRYDRADFRGHISGPLTKNLKVRASASYLNRDGYLPRVLTNGETEGGQDSFSGRGAALYEPNDRFSALVTVDGTRARDESPPLVVVRIDELGGIVALQNLVFGDPVCNPFVADPARFTNPTCINATDASPDGKFSHAVGGNVSDVDVFGVTANLQYRFDSFEMKSITGYRELDAVSVRVEPISPAIGSDTQIFDQWQFSQELQISGTAFDDRMKWVVGGFYMNEKGVNDDIVDIGVLTSFQSGGRVDNETVAGFGQFSYAVTERLSLTVGGRYTYEEKKWLPDQFVIEPNPVAVMLAIWPFPAGFPFLPAVEKSIDASEFTPAASLDFQFTDDVMGYVSYAKGFKGGGYTQRVFPPLLPAPGQDPVEVIPDFEPEFAENYEIGLKTELFDRRVRLNGAFFYTEYTDLQLNVLIGIAPTVRNAGDVTVYGTELELDAVPFDWLRVNAGLGYLHNEYDKVNPAAVEITKDTKLLNAPEWSGVFGATADVWRGDLGSLSLRIDWSHKSAMYKDAQNTPEGRSDNINTINASATFRTLSDRWALSFGATNLTDDRYVTSTFAQLASAGLIRNTIAPGREWFLRLKYNYE